MGTMEAVSRGAGGSGRTRDRRDLRGYRTLAAYRRECMGQGGVAQEYVDGTTRSAYTEVRCGACPPRADPAH